MTRYEYSTNKIQFVKDLNEFMDQEQNEGFKPRLGISIDRSSYIAHATTFNKIIIVNYDIEQDLPSRAINVGFTNIYILTMYPGRRLLGVTGNESGIYSTWLAPERGCEDPLAIACHPVNPSISQSCKANSNILSGSTVCTCASFAYYDAVTETCQRCNQKCID